MVDIVCGTCRGSGILVDVRGRRVLCWCETVPKAAA